ncbi:MAG: hypothetical protein JWQ64_1139 [Subtercola sp.]|nr:hypothetical protein [Subtercola sp.]
MHEWESAGMTLTGLPDIAGMVDRPALRRRLDRAFQLPVTLMVAQAGAGKSVLLAQWMAGHPEKRFVRVDVRRTDDDVIRFGRRLLEGLAEIDPAFDDLSPLLSLRGGGLGIALLEALTIQFADLGEVVIVLDDLSRVSNPSLLTDLEALAEMMPSNIHLVLATRVDPPPLWGRQRLRRNTLELRQSDLAFTEPEAAQLLQEVAGRPIEAESVGVLFAKTEGWAAGLQMAGLRLRFKPASDDFIAEFGGSDRMIADYLSGEVLLSLPDDRREILLRMSALDSMSAELVDAVTGTAGSQLVFEMLERSSLFLIPLDARRHWFRFHHLFRDLLRYRLRAEDPEVEQNVLLAAADWHLGHNDAATAVEYLLRAQQWNRVLDLVFDLGVEVFERGEMATVIRWITAVPDEVREHRVDVSLLLAVLFLTEGRPAAAEDLLSRIKADPRASVSQCVSAEVYLAALAQWRPRPQASIDHANRAVAWLENNRAEAMPDVLRRGDHGSLLTIALVSGGRAHFLAGDLSEARRWLERGLGSEGAAYSVWRVSALGSLALVEAWCGRTRRAEELSAEALAIALEVGLLAHPSVADAYFAAALVAIERGEPGGAALTHYEGMIRAHSNRRSQLVWIGELELALMQLGGGDAERAESMLVAAGHTLASPPSPIVADRIRVIRSRMLRAAGSFDQAVRLNGDEKPDSPALVFELTAAELSAGRVDRARRLVEQLAEPAKDEILRDVERRILLAWLADAEGNTAASRRILADALEFARPEWLVDVFVRAGTVVAAQIAALSATPTEFEAAILERSRIVRSAPGVQPLAEPLTSRELEILSFLPSRFTNAELAERCFVSVSTIKTHMAHIYRKLDAANRNSAIEQARRLGLL